MATQSILFLAPYDDLSAFTATGTLAALLHRLPEARIDIVCSVEQKKFYAPIGKTASKQLRFHLQNADAGILARGLLGIKFTGRFWHRVVALRGGILPALLWAGYRHIIQLSDSAYQSCDALDPSQICAPVVFVPDKQHLPLPQILSQTLHHETPLIVLACGEAGRAAWQAKHYAELAWRLTQAGGYFGQAHYALLDVAQSPMAEEIMANLPNGQVSFLADLPFAKQVALMHRAQAVIGSDRLVCRLAVACNVPMVVRLDAHAPPLARPYALFAGSNVSALADYLCAELAKLATKPPLSDSQKEERK